jgi:hypothetical protein
MNKLKVIAILYLGAAICLLIAGISQYMERVYNRFYLNLIAAGLFFIASWKEYIKFKKNIPRN